MLVSLGVAESALAAPANDNIADAAVLSGALPITQNGNTLGATRESGEPDHTGINFGNQTSVWHSWVAPSSGTFVAETCNSPSSAGLGVYAGDTIATLGPRLGTSSFCGGDDGSVTFTATANETYSIAVEGTAFGGAGPFELRLRQTNPPANDNFASAEAIPGALPTTTPGSTVDAGSEPSEPNHAGFAAQRSAWYWWTAPSTARYKVETCDSGSGASRVAVYTGTAVNALTPRASGANNCAGGGTASLDATSGTEYKIAVDSSNAGSFSLKIRQPNIPANDDFASATLIPSAVPSSTAGTTIDAGAEAGEPPHGGFNATASVWYRWTPPTAGTYAIDTCALTTGGRSLDVYTGADVSTLTSVATTMSNCTNASGARRILRATAGTEYRIAIDAPGPLYAQAGPFNLKIAEVQRPQNDDFADAITIAPAVPSTTNGNTDNATSETGEPNGQSSVWYSWTPSATDEYRLETCPSTGTGNSNLAVYTGGSVGSLTPVGTTTGCGTGRRVNLDGVAGTTYKIAVDGAGITGAFSLRIRELNPPPNDDIVDAFALSASPPSDTNGTTVDASAETGEPSHANSFPAVDSVWYTWSPSTSGPYSFSTCGSPEPGSGVAVYSDADGAYPLTFVSRGFSNCSNGGIATFDATASTQYLIAVEAGYFGQEGAFTLKLRDRSQAPVCTDASYTVESGRALQIPINSICSDDGPNPLIGQPVGGPGHGSLSPGSGGDIIYRSTVGYTGPESFAVRASDGEQLSNQANIMVTVIENSAGPNTAPACPDGTVFVPEGGSVSIYGNCADADGDSVSYGCCNPYPSGGDYSFIFNPVVGITYTPDPGTVSDSFGYTASDGVNPAVNVTVLIEVVDPDEREFESAPDATPAEPYAATVMTTGPGSVTIDARDVTAPAPTGYTLLSQEFDIEAPDAADPQHPLSLTFEIDSSQVPAGPITVFRNGIAISNCTGPTGQAVPDPCVQSRVVQGDGDVEITVLSTHASIWNFGEAEPDADPVASDDSRTVNEDSGATSFNVLTNDTDAESDAIEITDVSTPAHGTASVVDGSPDQVRYTPNADYCNDAGAAPDDTFTYTLNGGSTATVSVTVTCVDDNPVAVNDSKTLNEDASATTIDVLANDTDIDNGTKNIASKTNGTNGTVAITNGGADLTYMPASNFCGSDTFTYTLNGGSTATVSVTVTCVDDNPVDDDPIAVNDSGACDDATADLAANEKKLDKAKAKVKKAKTKAKKKSAKKALKKAKAAVKASRAAVADAC